MGDGVERRFERALAGDRLAWDDVLRSIEPPLRQLAARLRPGSADACVLLALQEILRSGTSFDPDRRPLAAWCESVLVEVAMLRCSDPTSFAEPAFAEAFCWLMADEASRSARWPDLVYLQIVNELSDAEVARLLLLPEHEIDQLRHEATVQIARLLIDQWRRSHEDEYVASLASLAPPGDATGSATTLQLLHARPRRRDEVSHVV